MQFGYNCKYYLPWFEKCRFLIDNKNLRGDLYCDKWLSIKEALIYSSLLNLDLIDLIKNNKVKIKKSRERISLGFFTAWEYDECPLARAGGQCSFFEQHTSRPINCIADLEALTDNHPNSPIIPSEQDVLIFKKTLLSMIEKKANKNQKKYFDAFRDDIQIDY